MISEDIACSLGSRPEVSSEPLITFLSSGRTLLRFSFQPDDPRPAPAGALIDTAGINLVSDWINSLAGRTKRRVLDPAEDRQDVQRDAHR